MRKNIFGGIASLLTVTFLLGGCGSSKKEGAQTAVTTVQNVARVGSDSCINTCHASAQDLTMQAGDTIVSSTGTALPATIPNAWRNSVHHIGVNGFRTVECEDCHGPGGQHFGIGPMPFPVPDHRRCLPCHTNYGEFNATAHANSDQLPDRFFFQGSTGTGQAASQGVPEVVAGTTTPVTKNQHIEECSVCHNSNQQFRYDASGNLTNSFNVYSSTSPFNTVNTANRTDLPNPVVACAACHDGHQVGLQATALTRVTAGNPAGNVVYPIFRKQQLAGSGPVIRPEFKPANTAAPVTTTELICAACHTKGLYKYSKAVTHQSNTFSQWSSSAHGKKTGLGWLKIPNTVANFPFDVSKQTLTTGASSGNADCFKCHNGLAAPMYMENVQLTPAAGIVWGGATAVCVTCHDPHKNSTGATSNVRVPVAMSRYSSANAGFGLVSPQSRVPGTRVKFSGVGTFLDLKPLPVTSNSTICIFCHQGRQSGYTLFQQRILPGSTQPLVLTTNSFFNPHYLGTAGMLWGANAYEYGSKLYSANGGHQTTNCAGCHMANQTEPVADGGHTWRPNPASCTPCHGTITASTDLTALLNIDVNALKIKELQTKLIQLFDLNGIYYNDTKNPYFFTEKLDQNKLVNSTTSYTNWSPQALKAAFNLAFVVKGLPGEGAEGPGARVQLLDAAGVGTGIWMPATTQTLSPNRSAAVHNHLYAIQLLTDSFNDYLAVAPIKGAFVAIPDAERPAGARPAWNYATGTSDGTYNPVQ